ncbi:hypothetical protein ME0901_17850 [Lactobacillus delbrueckii subsp. bulgaricus]|uniref:Transposase n=1 Tax=Lactobacillus delbrueckii subsp. bulgaricus TaxID=1585 RepID=A0AAV5PF52_LACDE|nr:hypothetical protein ME0899_07500 [Lactobacillus delbrueckii subsp. bulgaricus]GMB86839.1 hypothetical protein ME0900_12120 [Lactobacillus delbrueckii subsp. bulgaricus]GMB89263.1 hypothetical protein ME0901_17850 [Lactobacillus delbrueckii subsp. bulgaricus]
MKVSTRFSDSIHLLAFLVIYKGKTTLSSNIIASCGETVNVEFKGCRLYQDDPWVTGSRAIKGAKGYQPAGNLSGN